MWSDVVGSIVSFLHQLGILPISVVMFIVLHGFPDSSTVANSRGSPGAVVSSVSCSTSGLFQGSLKSKHVLWDILCRWGRSSWSAGAVTHLFRPPNLGELDGLCPPSLSFFREFTLGSLNVRSRRRGHRPGSNARDH